MDRRKAGRAIETGRVAVRRVAARRLEGNACDAADRIEAISGPMSWAQK